MSKPKVAVAIAAFSCTCWASPVVPSKAEPAIYNVMSAHYEAAFCRAPAVTPEDKAKLIKAAMAVSTPGVVYDQIFTPMEYAVIADDVPSIRHLIGVGYALTAKLPPDGGSLLHLAAWNGSLNAALFLLEHGIDPNVTNASGGTPLMIAASEGRINLVKLLLAHRAEVRTRMQDGSTPLSYSMICKDQRLVDLLLTAGAQVDFNSRRLAATFGLSLHEHGL